MNTTKQSVMDRLLAALGRRCANRSGKNLRARSLRVETLENRELLSATDILSEVATTLSFDGFADSAYYSVETIEEETIDVSTVGGEDVDGFTEYKLGDENGAFEGVDETVWATDFDENVEEVENVEEIVEVAVPAAPSDISFGTYDLETHKVPMYWVDNADNEDGFYVQFSTDGGQNWHDSQKDVIGADVTERVATGVYTNHTYDFRICAYNAGGISEYAYATYAPLESVSTGESVVAVGSQVSASVAPEGATADYAWFVSEDGIDWSDNPIATGSDYTPVPDDSNCFLKVVATGTEYNFGQVSTVVGPILSNGPAAPSDVVLGEYDLETGLLPMSWTLNSDNEERIDVQYTIDGGQTWRNGAILNSGTESRDARVVRVGQTYQFRVRAVNENGASTWAYSESFVPQAEVSSISVDYSQFAIGEKLTTSLTSNAVFSIGSVKATYSWSRSVDGETWSESIWNGSSYTISPDDAGCYLKVTATGKSPYYYGSAEFVTDLVPEEPSAPAAPSDFVIGAYNLETGELATSWTLNSTNETAVNVQYSIDGGQTWRDGAVLEAGTESRDARVVRVGQTYQFRVNASNAFGASDWAYSESFAPQAEVVGVSVDVVDVNLDNLSSGDKLVAKPESNASYSVGSVKADYAWYRSIDGENWSDVLWTGSSYTLTNSDANCYVKVVATGKSPYYYGSAEYITEKIEREKVAPAAPSDFYFGYYDAETGELGMGWTLNSDNEERISVQYSIDGGETWRVAAELGAGNDVRVGWSVRVGNVYQYRVCASNQYGVSDWTYSESYVPKGEIVEASIEWTTLTVGAQIKAGAETDAQFIAGRIGVDYEWFRSVDGETWTTTGSTDSTYTIQAADLGCYLKVVATGRPESYYGWMDVETDERVLASVDGIVVEGEAKYGATLTAKVAPEDAVVAYEWLRSADGENWEAVGATEASYTIQKADSDCFLKVVATGVEEAGFTGVVSAETERVIGVPAAPSDVILGDYNLETGELAMSWTLNSTDEIAVGVEYSIDGGETWIVSEKETAVLPAGTTSRLATNVRVGLQYRFRVCAKGEIGDSDWAYSETFTPTASLTEITTNGRRLGVGSIVETSLTSNAAFRFGEIDAVYEWYRSEDGETWNLIDGANEANYTATLDDLGCMLKVVATGLGVYDGLVEATTGFVSADSTIDEVLRSFGEDDWLF